MNLTDVNSNKENDDHNNNLTIKPEELKKKIDNGEDIFILDVRNKEEHDAWTISYDRYKDSSVIPVDKIFSNDSLKQIPKDKEIITFCAHGHRSAIAAQALSSLGYIVKTVHGGMSGWSKVYDIASINTGVNSIKIWQIRRISKGCMSYIVASMNDKKATIIDATCGIDKTIDDLLKEKGLEVTKVIDTHMHADHLSGLTKIAIKYGAETIISSLEKYNFENLASNKDLNLRLVGNMERLEIGDGCHLEAIHTPGHTDGSMSFRLDIKNNYEIEKKEVNKNHENNIFFFSGDTIFVNGVGRPDLHDKAKEYTRNLFQTYLNRIFNLPTNAIVLPSHYNSIFKYQNPIYNSIKDIKQKLQSISNSEKDFVDFVFSNIPPQPMNYKRIVWINKNMSLCNAFEHLDLESGPNSCGINA